MAAQAVFDNVDLVASILRHVEMDPLQFVHIGRVSTTWRQASRLDETLLLRAARAPAFLTKRTFAGLFGLLSHEAVAFPHRERAHRGGVMHVYEKHAIDGAMAAIHGVHFWKLRLARQAATAARVEHALRCRRDGGVWGSRKRVRDELALAA